MFHPATLCIDPRVLKLIWYSCILMSVCTECSILIAKQTFPSNFDRKEIIYETREILMAGAIDSDIEVIYYAYTAQRQLSDTRHEEAEQANTSFSR